MTLKSSEKFFLGCSFRPQFPWLSIKWPWSIWCADNSSLWLKTAPHPTVRACLQPAFSHVSYFQAVISGSAKCCFQFCLYLTALLSCDMQLFEYIFSFLFFFSFPFLSLASDEGNRAAIPYCRFEALKPDHVWLQGSCR